MLLLHAKVLYTAREKLSGAVEFLGRKGIRTYRHEKGKKVFDRWQQRETSWDLEAVNGDVPAHRIAAPPLAARASE
jgi:hypothetical protein